MSSGNYSSLNSFFYAAFIKEAKMTNGDNIVFLSTMIELFEDEFFNSQELKNKRFKVGDFVLTIDELKQLLKYKKRNYQTAESSVNEQVYTLDQFSSKITKLANDCGGNPQGFPQLTDLIQNYKRIHGLAVYSKMDELYTN